MYNMNTGQSAMTDESVSSKFAPVLFLYGVNTPVCVQLLINKPVFSIGKSDSCDGVLAFNPEISKEHCRIIYRNGEYFVVDLNSTNRTYLNDEVLDRGTEYLLHVRDRLRLSTLTFSVEPIYGRTDT